MQHTYQAPAVNNSHTTVMSHIIVLHFHGEGSLKCQGTKDVWVTKYSTVDTVAQTVASEFGNLDAKDLKFYGATEPEREGIPGVDYDDDPLNIVPPPKRGAAISLHDIVASVKDALNTETTDKSINYNSRLEFGDGFAVDWTEKVAGIGTSGNGKKSKDSTDTEDPSARAESGDDCNEDDAPQPGRSRPGRRETQPWHREAIEKVYDHMLR